VEQAESAVMERESIGEIHVDLLARHYVEETGNIVVEGIACVILIPSTQFWTISTSLDKTSRVV
jgi:hypothetical protein